MAGTPDSSAWQRLGTLLERRRVELDPRYKNLTLFAQERGVDGRMAWDIERARRTNFRRPSRRAIEVAYGWQPGSIDAVLDGGEPSPVSASVHHIATRKPPDPGTGYTRPTYADPSLEAFAAKIEREFPDLLHRDVDQLAQTRYLNDSWHAAQERIAGLEAENERLEAENKRLAAQLKRAHLRSTG